MGCLGVPDQCVLCEERFWLCYTWGGRTRQACGVWKILEVMNKLSWWCADWIFVHHHHAERNWFVLGSCFALSAGRVG